MMVAIQKVQKIAFNILLKWGFRKDEAELIVENFIEGELTGKKTHGLIRLPWLKKLIDAGDVKISTEEIKVIKETPVSLFVDGMVKTGFYVVNKALQLGIAKAKQSGLVAVGVTNTSPASGLIGLYARKATENDLIFIGFNSSPGGLVPFGSIEALWGTNPITIGIPTLKTPFILDMASSQITWGHLLLACDAGKRLPKGVAINEDGNPTTNPIAAMKGGLLPISGHKGSGLAMAVTLLASTVKGGWGSFFILLDPSILRETDEFKKEVQVVIDELKGSRKQKGVKDIFYPGEQSCLTRQLNLQNGYIELSDGLWRTLNNL